MKLKTTPLISAALLLSFCIRATSQTLPPGGDDNEMFEIIVIKEKKNPDIPKRRKTPSAQHINCMYADENLYITFAIPEGECTMTVTDQETGISLQYIFDTEETAEVYVGSLSSAYIELDTENGHSYEGWIE